MQLENTRRCPQLGLRDCEALRKPLTTGIIIEAKANLVDTAVTRLQLGDVGQVYGENIVCLFRNQANTTLRRFREEEFKPE